MADDLEQKRYSEAIEKRENKGTGVNGMIRSYLSF
jgi:hypothetical protein